MLGFTDVTLLSQNCQTVERLEMAPIQYPGSVTGRDWEKCWIGYQRKKIDSNSVTHGKDWIF